VGWKQHPQGALLERFQKLEARPWFLPDCFWRSPATSLGTRWHSGLRLEPFLTGLPLPPA